jgi:hypothetical protein
VLPNHLTGERRATSTRGEKERDAFACIRTHQAFALAPVTGARADAWCLLKQSRRDVSRSSFPAHLKCPIRLSRISPIHPGAAPSPTATPPSPSLSSRNASPHGAPQPRLTHPPFLLSLRRPSHLFNVIYFLSPHHAASADSGSRRPCRR